MGVVSVCLLTFLWWITLDPLKMHPRFPGGLKGGAIAMSLAVACSFLAALFGKRLWLFIALWAVLTFVYIGFFYRMPLWY